MGNCDLLNFDIALKLETDKAQQARILNNMGAAYQSLGEYDKALERYKASLRIKQEIGTDRLGQAMTLNNIDTIHYKTGSCKEAQEAFEQSLKTIQEIQDKREEARTRHNLGLAYKATGNYDEALGHYTASLRMTRDLNDRRGEAATLNSMATVYAERGSYDEALKQYAASLQIKEEVKDESGKAMTLVGMGNVYDSLRQAEAAIAAYKAALEIFRKRKMRAEEAATWHNLGGAYEAVDNDPMKYYKALDYYRKSLGIRREIDDKAGQAGTLNNIGIIYKELKEYEAAQQQYEESLKIVRAIGDKAGEAATLINMGGVHELTGNYAKALEAYRAALDIAAPLQDAENIVRSYWGIGKVYQAQAQWSQAISAFREAVKQVEKMRQSAAIDYLKASFVEQYMDVFDGLVQCELAVAQNEAAFTDAESSRARALLDLLTERKVDVRTGAKPELLQRERELMDLAAAQANRLRELKSAKEPDAETVRALEAQLMENERQLDAVKIQLRGTHYATLQYPQPITITEAQKLLPPGTALLAYYVMEDETALWVVTATKVKVHRLPVKVKQLEADIVTAFRVPMKRAAGSRGIFVPRPEEKAKARSLYQQLIAPVRVDLQGIKRLVIVPHRALFYLPFAALEMGEKGTAGDGGKRQGNGGKARYLIEDYAIVVVPSATALRDIRNSKSEIRNSRFIGTLGTPEPKSEMNTVLAFAPFGEEKKQRVKTFHVPTRPPTKSRAGSGLPRVPTSRDTEAPPLQNAHNSSLEFMRSYYRDAGLGFKPLYFSDDEVESVSRLFRPPGKAYVGDKATEARVKAECGRYRFLLFATHGILDDRNPQYSGVALAEARNPKSEIPDESGLSTSRSRDPKSEDGFLQTQEIFNLTLNADLVALSACETAFGRGKQSVKESNAEGFIGLTRGFLYAGTPTVVVSLWKVADESTSPLMIEFYRQLVSGKCDKAEAMRRAQLKMLRNSKFAYPFHWAAFVVVGDWR